MDLIIKSFNRPYYLDRCLKSIVAFVKGDISIKIIDDGTPEKYLEKIQSDYPYVKIYKTNYYSDKSEAIKLHLDGIERFNLKTIPSGYWYKVVSEATNKFILIEDDIWFIRRVDFDHVLNVMDQKNISMFRLSWQGNLAMVPNGDGFTYPDIKQVIPDISMLERIIFTNKFKIRSLGYRLGLFHDIMKYQIKFYSLYAVASAVFDKEYWLYIWSGALNRVHEESQLIKASKWILDNKNNSIARVEHEVTQTSYITSTNNNFSDVNFDMFILNNKLNESWFENKLDVMQNFPLDFSTCYLKDKLNMDPDRSDDFYNSWLIWIDRFKSQYRKVGCLVE